MSDSARSADGILQDSYRWQCRCGSVVESDSARDLNDAIDSHLQENHEMTLVEYNEGGYERI